MTQKNKPVIYRVGYKKPPPETQFKRGQSGNPRGRPKGTLNLATVLERTLREQVIISEGGRRKVISKMEAALKQLVNKAASGDLAALRQLLALVISAEERFNTASTPASEFSEVDRLVMQSVIKRFDSTPKGDSNSGADT